MVRKYTTKVIRMKKPPRHSTPKNNELHAVPGGARSAPGGDRSAPGGARSSLKREVVKVPSLYKMDTKLSTNQFLTGNHYLNTGDHSQVHRFSCIGACNECHEKHLVSDLIRHDGSYEPGKAPCGHEAQEITQACKTMTQQVTVGGVPGSGVCTFCYPPNATCIPRVRTWMRGCDKSKVESFQEMCGKKNSVRNPLSDMIRALMKANGETDVVMPAHFVEIQHVNGEYTISVAVMENCEFMSGICDAILTLLQRPTTRFHFEQIEDITHSAGTTALNIAKYLTEEYFDGKFDTFPNMVRSMMQIHNFQFGAQCNEVQTFIREVLCDANLSLLPVAEDAISLERKQKEIEQEEIGRQRKEEQRKQEEASHQTDKLNANAEPFVPAGSSCGVISDDDAAGDAIYYGNDNQYDWGIYDSNVYEDPTQTQCDQVGVWRSWDQQGYCHPSNQYGYRVYGHQGYYSPGYYSPEAQVS